MFYDEHTFGAAESVDDPLAENSQTQWNEKSAYVWTAVKDANLLREDAFGLFQDFLPRSEVPTLAVVNTLNWPRSGLAHVFIDDQILPRDREFRIVDTETGEGVPALVEEMAVAARAVAADGGTGCEVELVGAPGSGRRTLLAQLAVRLGHRPALLEPGGGKRALRTARLLGALPVWAAGSDDMVGVDATPGALTFVARRTPASAHPNGIVRLSWTLPAPPRRDRNRRKLPWTASAARASCLPGAARCRGSRSARRLPPIVSIAGAPRSTARRGKASRARRAMR